MPASAMLMQGETPSAEPASAVPIVVVSTSGEPVEVINGALRRDGIPAHCTWLAAVTQLPETLAQLDPQLLVLVGSLAELAPVASLRDAAAPGVPLLLVAPAVDEDVIDAALRAGARDVVSIEHVARLQAVMARELRHVRVERALEQSARAVRDYRAQLDTVLRRSNDAIVHVQEGIVVDANGSWLGLFGHDDDSALVGQPLMDLFDESAHAALKGALAACLQGRWNEHTLKATAVRANGSTLSLELVPTLSEHDGEPSIRLVVPARGSDDGDRARDSAADSRLDGATGLLHRRALLAAVRERLAQPPPGGERFIAAFKLDKFARVERDVGIAHSEAFVARFGDLLRGHLGPQDLAGRFGGVSFLVLFDRGGERDAIAWAEQLVQLVSRDVLDVHDKSLAVTCTCGLVRVPTTDADFDGVLGEALDACTKGRARGGNQVFFHETRDTDTRVIAYDKIWVKHIKSALMENRFRLVQQPIASLRGDTDSMFDVLVRMVDPQGREVLPSEFIAAAERNELMKNIDRWVFGASLAFAAQRRPGCLFVRTSLDSLRDAALPEWLDHQVRTLGADPPRLCFQVTEQLAATHVVDVQHLARALRERGFRFAIEAFGSGRDPVGLLAGLPVDFVKIDGALVQKLTSDETVQERVRELARAAAGCGAGTIAERVEDANTMAVLWQLEIQYIQGFLVHEPEEVVL